jgi:hypothetical protein
MRQDMRPDVDIGFIPLTRGLRFAQRQGGAMAGCWISRSILVVLAHIILRLAANLAVGNA